MAWNKPSERAVSTKPSTGRRGRSPRPTIIAGTIIVLGAAVAAWWFWPGASAPVAEDGDDAARRRIREVVPAVAPDQAPRQKASGEAAKETPSVKTYIDGQGVERYPGGARVPRKKPKLVELPDRRPVKWKYACEGDISTIVELEPGDMLIGDVTYGERFVRDFKESLKEEIVIEPEDDWYQRQLKEDLIAAKKDLAEAMNRGEDIAQIMTEARRELRKLSEYRDQVCRQVNTLMHDPKYSEADLEDLAAAANQMLKDNGCRQMPFTRAMIKKLIRRNQGKKGKNKQ